MIKFAGEYVVQAKPGMITFINDAAYENGTHIKLATGNITTRSTQSFRLALVPQEQSLQLNPAFAEDDWERIIF